MGRLRTLWPIRATETKLELAQYNSTLPEAGYPDRLGPSGKCVDNSAKITYLQITDHVRYSVMASRTSNQAWSKGSDTRAYVNCNSPTSNCQCAIFSKKKSNDQDFLLIRTCRRGVLLHFCIQRWSFQCKNTAQSTDTWQCSVQAVMIFIWNTARGVYDYLASARRTMSTTVLYNTRPSREVLPAIRPLNSFSNTI